jgi:signal transduction histidine kinase/DNA-binding response OmpR family regulator
VLEFDGVSWRSIKVPNWSVLSMAIDDTGTIYVGGKDEMGFLAPDSEGSLQYVSLLDHLEDNQRNFSTVWKIHSTGEGVYFHTLKFLFRWNPLQKQIKGWKPDYRFNASFTCGGKLFIRQEKIGLMQMDTVNDSLKLIPGGETFATKKVYMIAPYDTAAKKLLIGTRSNGFYIYDGISARPFPTAADDYIKEKQLYHGIRLVFSSTGPGDFALATRLGGLLILDAHGALKAIFAKASGLQDDNVKYVFEDFRGNLWLALNDGISKIEYASPFSIYDDRANLPGLVLSVVKHRNHLYVGTSSGLYFLSFDNKFYPVSGISDYCWSLLSIGDSLLAAASGGVFQVDDIKNIKLRIIENPSYVLQQSKMDPNRIWVGTRGGLVSLYLDAENNKDRLWRKEYAFENITLEVRTMVEDKKGNLWLGTLTKGVLSAVFPVNGTIIHPAVKRYDTSYGLPSGEVNVFMAAGHVMFATGKGIYRFNEKDKFFVPDSTLGDEFAGGSKGVFRIVEDRNKHTWFHSRRRNFWALPGPGGSFVLNPTSLLRRIPHAQVNTIYPDPNDDATWFGGTNGLIRYDTTIKKNYKRDFPVLIRKVLVNGNLIFGGYKHEHKYKIDKDIDTNDDSNLKHLFPVIEYKDRNLRFDFAAPFFEDESRTEYRSLLEGYDEVWSEWHSETKKYYTNLDPGLYTFRVQAKNVYGHPGREAAFQFKVLPPWYKTWLAFLGYLLVSFLGVYFIVRWRSLKLVGEKQKLERIVKERTKEINLKSQQLEKKTFQLKEQSVKLQEMAKMKSRFFANISHEFRTPLTLIIGPLEQILSDYRCKDSQLVNKLNLMLRNSQRLLMLINQLLDLSKFDSGKMRLQAARQNIIPFLKGILASFELLATQKKLDLRFHAKEENITLYFDPEKMEGAVCNLLLNAVKFTPPGGKITVTVYANVTENRTKKGNFPSTSTPEFLEISICDTGIGIPKDQLGHIFDRFYQGERSISGLGEHDHKGSGIGLALAKELISLHHGRIDVHSREGKNSGTEFIIRLPMGEAHLKPYEIISPSEIPSDRGKSFEITAAYRVEKEAKEPVTANRNGKTNIAGTFVEPGKDIEKEPEFEPEPRGQKKNVILVVEDNAEVRNYIREPLDPLYTVVEARDGKEGIKVAIEIIPDLIISDIMMPGVDGYELCRVLKNEIKTSHIPIILLTAKASEESIIQGLETGADDYITKPFNSKILTTRIKNLIDLRRQMQKKIQRQKMLLPAEISVSSIDEEFLKEFQAIVEKHLSDPEFNIDQLCKELYMGRTTLFSKIEALTGESPKQFIQSYRLERAAQLLKSDFGNVTEVAFKVGFSSSAYFTKCFKEKFHQLPSTFQASESGRQRQGK